jgi:transcriptional regulator with XRE-family HTH domain
MGFAERLRTHRERAGVTKTELARSLGVSFTAVHAWESGKTPPPLPRVRDIAKRLSIPKSDMEVFCNEATMGRVKPETADVLRGLWRQLGTLRREIERLRAKGELPFFNAIPLPDDARDKGRSDRQALSVGEQPAAYSSAKSDRYILEVAAPVAAESPEKRLFPGDHVIVEKTDSNDPRPYDDRICVVLLDGKPLLRQVVIQSAGKTTTVLLRGGEGDVETLIPDRRDFRIIGVVVRLVSRGL